MFKERDTLKSHGYDPTKHFFFQFWMLPIEGEFVIKGKGEV